MSTEQQAEAAVDPQLIEETKQQIRSLVNEVAALARSEIGPDEFYPQFLDRVVSALAAIGGAVWTLNQSGQFELSHQLNIQETNLGSSEQWQKSHGMLLQSTVKSGEGTLVPAGYGASDGEAEGNPTSFLLVLAPVLVEKQVQALVEIFQRPGARPNTQRGYLRFLLQMCELFGDYLKSRQLRSYTDRQAMWGQLDNFTRIAHSSLDPTQTAYTIANEGRRLIECDRVSVAIRKGNRCKIVAVSGQDTFDKRSNTITLLGELATAVTRSGDDVWYTGDTRDMPPQVEEAVEAYVDESHTKTLGVLPLFPPQPPSEDGREPTRGEPIGALIIEQIEDVRSRQGMQQRVDVVRGHSSTALANSIEHNSLFLMPVWRTIGKSKALVAAKTLPKTVAVALGLLAALLALIFVPAEFELEGRGALQPKERHEVFTGMQGTVTSVRVKQGDYVEPGQILVTLRNTELEGSLADIVGQIAQAKADLFAKQSMLLQGDQLQRDQLLQVSGEVQELRQRLASLDRQLEVLREKEAMLTIRSPDKGVVLTWNPKDELENRPVERGQLLLLIGDPDKEWELEVNMPEEHMGHIVRAEQEAEAENRKLPVEYILSTQPGNTLHGSIREIHQAAEVKQDQSTVRMTVDIDKNDIAADDRYHGATVIARVGCGTRSVGYVWFHEVIAFFQSRVLFRWF